MVDPRIYRAVWVIVFVALIVSGFSLDNKPAPASTDLAPGVSFASAATGANAMAARFGAVSAGSRTDAEMASYIAGQLRAAGGFSVTTQTAVTRTVGGVQPIETVQATRPGLDPGTVVVIANRDVATPVAPKSTADTTTASPVASTAASAVLLGLAKEMSGATLDRSLTLISTSGSVGAAGTAALAHSLAGNGTDAVIVLGDLAGSEQREPVVLPWSGTNLLSPSLLTSTLGGYVRAQTGLSTADPSIGSEFAQLAFPFATGGQAPFAALGIPAVGLSLSGDRTARADEPVDTARISRLGLAVDQTVSALDSGVAVPAPGAYLTISAQLVPLWAVRLLVLALILPVAFTLVDALARARRRGHSILSWLVWVLSGIAPFIVGLAVIKVAGVAHVLSAPPEAVASELGFSVAGAGVIAVALVATAVAFRLLRPVGVQVASGIGWRRTPSSPPIEGATVALAIVMCALTFLVWVFNPFAAALLVPALHLWLWLGSPQIAISRLRALTLLLAGLIFPLLIAVYYMLALDLAPWEFAWSLTLALAGGAVGIGTGLSWCVALGVLAGAVVLLRRAAGAPSTVVDGAVTVRGPAGYAGPGSLGGTESALRQ
jgi:hypothetical protein